MSTDTREKKLPIILLGLLLLLVAVAGLKTRENKDLQPMEDEAAFEMKPGGAASVVQVRNPMEPARARSRAYVMSLSQEIFIDIVNPDTWFRAHLTELEGQSDLDTAARITLDSVAFEPLADKDKYQKRSQLLQEQKSIQAEMDAAHALPETDPNRKITLDGLKKRQDDLNNGIDALLEGARYNTWMSTVNDCLNRCRLVVNGRIFADLKGEVEYYWDEYAKDPKIFDRYYTLRFHLTLTEDGDGIKGNKSQWLDLLGGVGLSNKPVTVSIAYVSKDGAKSEILPTAISPSTPKKWQNVLLRANDMDLATWLLSVVFVLLLGGFIYMSFSTNLLREKGRDGLWHLSLGHCQMAFWFFTIFGCYIFLLIIIGDYKTLTSQELLLMGISAATGLSAAYLGEGGDHHRPTPAPQEGRSEAPRGRAGFVAECRKALNDLLSEENTNKPDFHRFQMIGWTLVFGVIFCRAVYLKLAMPEFTAEQLLLIGISNGTYLGFKYQDRPAEKPKPEEGKPASAPISTPAPDPISGS